MANKGYSRLGLNLPLGGLTLTRACMHVIKTEVEQTSHLILERAPKIVLSPIERNLASLDLYHDRIILALVKTTTSHHTSA
jgi:hypothetical protein